MLNIDIPWSQNLPHADPVAGWAQFITCDDILKPLRDMKNGKVAGPSGVIAEMLKAAPDICYEIIADLINAIILEGKVSADWSNSIIVSLFKGKGVALDLCWNFIERVVKNITHGTVDIDEVQLDFCPGRGKTDAIFILAKHGKLYMAFVYLEKAFDRVSWKVLWWVLRVVSVLEWLIKAVQAMYVGARIVSLGSTLVQISDDSWNVWRPHDKNSSMEKWSKVKRIEGEHGENQSYDFGERSLYIANLW